VNAVALQPMRAIVAACVGMAPLDDDRLTQKLPPLPSGVALHLGV